MLNTSLTSNKNDQHLLIAAFLALAYLVWVIYEPTQGRCTTMPMAYAAIRVLLVFGWLIYIINVKAKSGLFSWRSFCFGALSGGALLSLLLVGIGLVLPDQENPYHPIKQHFEPLVQLAPATAISGLYASFSASSKAALGSGLLCFVLQFVFLSLLTLPISCAY